jgi:hypothetical protein
MTPWRARLSGETFDLEILPTLFSSPDLRVVDDGDQGYFLEAVTLETKPDHMAVFEEAQRLLPLLNGAARLHSSSHRDVSLSGQVVEPNADGEPKRHHMIIASTVQMRTRMGAVVVRQGEESPPEPPPGSAVTDRWLRLATGDSDVNEAMTIWGSKPHDWHNLYKVYEIIRANADIKRAGWASATELSAFTGSANHQGATGSEARHSRMRGDPPSRVISLPEADAFIGHLLTSWLTSLPDP